MKHEVARYGGAKVLRIRCEGCKFEDSQVRCIRHILDALAEHPDVGELRLEGTYFREYSGKSLEALKELSEVLHSGRVLLERRLTLESCSRCEGERREALERLLEKLPESPAGVLVGLRKMLCDLKRGSGRPPCSECKRAFAGSLKTLALMLEESSAVKEGLSALRPRLRPPFSSARIDAQVPQGFVPVEKYSVEGGEVEIFFNRSKLQHLYFLFPFEYRLIGKDLEVLSLAKQRLAESVQLTPAELVQARAAVKRRAEEVLAAIGCRADDLKIQRMAECLVRATAGLGLLDTLLSDPKVQDVYVDAPAGENPVHIVHSDFGECTTNIYLTDDGVGWLVSKFRLMSGRPFSEAFPVLDLDLGGSRCTAVGPPLSPAGVSLAIRRHRSEPWTLPRFVARGFLSPEAAALLSILVDAQTAMLITGSRGAGKTSLLSSLLLEIPPSFRIITIEDTPELPVKQMRELGFKILPLMVQSVIRGSGNELRADEALRTAMRLGESILVVGEVRGPEAKVLYEAMRVGTAGNAVIGTIHGSSARDVFERVVFDLGIPESSFRATDVIAVVSTVREGGRIARSRKLTEIVEVGKSEKSGTEFKRILYYDPAGKKFRMELRKSHLLERIACRWGIGKRHLFEMLRFKSAVFRDIALSASEAPAVLEADFAVKANLKWRELLEINRVENVGRIFAEWRSWFRKEVEGCRRK